MSLIQKTSHVDLISTFMGLRTEFYFSSPKKSNVLQAARLRLYFGPHKPFFG